MRGALIPLSEKRRLDGAFLCGIVLLIGIRIAVLVVDQQSLEQDPDSYRLLAENLANTGVFGFAQADGGVRPTAFRPFFYPWLLSWLVVNGELQYWLVGWFQVALSLAAAGLAYSIGRRLGIGWPGLAAFALAIDPLMLRQSQLVMTETWTSFIVLAAWRVWLGCVQTDIQRLWQSIFLGLLLGIAVLSRPTNVPWAALCCLATYFIWLHPSRARRLQPVLILGLCMLLFLAPWTIRNYFQLGKPIWATSHGGYTLMLANNPLLFEHFKQSGADRNWDAEPFHRAWMDRKQTFANATDAELLDPGYWRSATQDQLRPQTLGELADDKLAYRIARLTITNDPLTFGRSTLYRLSWFWALWPNVPGRAAMLIGLWYAIFFGAAFFGFVKLFVIPSWMARTATKSAAAAKQLAWRNLRSWFPAIVLVLSLSGIHAVYWGNMRMRAPLMAPVYLLAFGWRNGNRFQESAGDESEPVNRSNSA